MRRKIIQSFGELNSTVTSLPVAFMKLNSKLSFDQQKLLLKPVMLGQKSRLKPKPFPGVHYLDYQFRPDKSLLLEDFVDTEDMTVGDLFESTMAHNIQRRENLMGCITLLKLGATQKRFDLTEVSVIGAKTQWGKGKKIYDTQAAHHGLNLLLNPSGTVAIYDEGLDVEFSGFEPFMYFHPTEETLMAERLKLLSATTFPVVKQINTLDSWNEMHGLRTGYKTIVGQGIKEFSPLSLETVTLETLQTTMTGDSIKLANIVQGSLDQAIVGDQLLRKLARDWRLSLNKGKKISELAEIEKKAVIVAGCEAGWDPSLKLEQTSPQMLSSVLDVYKGCCISTEVLTELRLQSSALLDIDSGSKTMKIFDIKKSGNLSV